MQSVSIRELVRDYGVTLFALRHYESKGLLKRSTTAKQWRRYSMEDVQRLKTIVELAATGPPLAEIREVLADDSAVPDRIAAMVARYTAKRDMLTNRIDRLRSYTTRGE